VAAKDKVFSILCFLGLFGLWYGFFKCLSTMPTSWTPASIVYIIIALALFVGAIVVSIILIAGGYYCWIEDF